MGDHPLIKQPVRMVPFVHREISAMMNELLAPDVIQPSASAWSSPVVLVPEKDSTSRFCMDYERLNCMSRNPLPHVDILNMLSWYAGWHDILSLHDLHSGYWQMELDPKTRPKSVFVTHRRLHEFIRLPFGLCNGPSTFQRLTEVILNGLAWHSCVVYIHDVLVCLWTFEEQLN